MEDLLRCLAKLIKGYQSAEILSLPRIHQLKVTSVLNWLVIFELIWLLMMLEKELGVSLYLSKVKRLTNTLRIVVDELKLESLKFGSEHLVFGLEYLRFDLRLRSHSL